MHNKSNFKTLLFQNDNVNVLFFFKDWLPFTSQLTHQRLERRQNWSLTTPKWRWGSKYVLCYPLHIKLKRQSLRITSLINRNKIFIICLYLNSITNYSIKCNLINNQIRISRLSLNSLNIKLQVCWIIFWFRCLFSTWINHLSPSLWFRAFQKFTSPAWGPSMQVMRSMEPKYRLKCKQLISTNYFISKNSYWIGYHTFWN